jgi:hypothetical protein
MLRRIVSADLLISWIGFIGIVTWLDWVGLISYFFAAFPLALSGPNSDRLRGAGLGGGHRPVRRDSSALMRSTLGGPLRRK